MPTTKNIKDFIDKKKRYLKECAVTENNYNGKFLKTL